MSRQPSASDFAALFSDCTSLEQCMWKALNEACSQLQAQAGTFFELDTETKSLQVAATYGILPWRVAKGQFPITQGICGWVGQNKEAVIVNDVSKDPRFNHQIDLITQFKTVSVLCAPVISKGRALGVVELINRHDQPFTPDDLTHLQTLIEAASSRLQELR